METVLFTTIAAVLIILSIAFHEAGHAYAMMKRGIKIHSAGLGIPVPYLTVTLHPKSLGFPVKLSPLLLGAFVQPEESETEKITRLPKRDQAAIYAAGIEANIIFGGVLLVGLALVTMLFEPWRPQRVLVAVIVMAIIVLGTLFRNFFRQYLYPVLGIIQLAILVVGFLGIIAGIGISGPIGIARSTVSTSLAEAIAIAAVISISIGLTNMLPLNPLDGGRLTTLWLPTAHSRAIFVTVSTFAFAALIISAIASDIFNLFH